MKVSKNLAIIPSVLIIFYSLICIFVLATFAIPLFLYACSLTSSFDKYKYAPLLASRFKEVFLDKDLELYDWQLEIIGKHTLDNQHFTLMDLNLDPEQTEKAKEIVKSMEKQLESKINKIFIIIGISAAVFLFALSFVCEIFSNRVKKDYLCNSLPSLTIKSFDIKGENILNSLILRPFWPNCLVKLFKKEEVNQNIKQEI